MKPIDQVKDYLKKEKLQIQPIRQISFVIPAYNEAENLEILVHNISTLLRPNSISLWIVISDNGSNDETPNILSRLAVEEYPIESVNTSIPRSIGSARNTGVSAAAKNFREQNPFCTSNEHIIVNFDADTLVVNKEFLIAIYETFSNPLIMVAHGPIEWLSTEGDIDKKYKYLQHLLANVRLKRLFSHHGRDLSHFISNPRDIFAGACTIIRESALHDNEEMTLNFEQTDRVGEDIRFSLLLQQKFHSSQIVKDKRFLVRTSARGLETESGKISVFKGLSRLIRVIFVGDHVPEKTKDKSFEHDSQFNNTLFDVVGNFIKKSDRVVYNLQDNEYVEQVVKLEEREFKKKRNSGIDIRSAISAISGKTIPGSFVIVKR